MNKPLKLKTLLIVLLVGILIFRVLTFLFPSFLMNLLFGEVPDNPNFSISSQLKPEEIISKDLGGSDYYELIYDKNLDGRRWLVPCYSAIGVDDAEDVCKGFARGYLRKYTAYKLLDGTVVGGNYRISQDISFSAEGGWTTIVYEKEKLGGDYALLLNILEYDSPNEAKSASSFFITDASFETIQMDGVNILIKEEEGDWTHYVLPTDKTMISIQGNRAAVREAMRAVVEKYKKGV